MDSLITILVLVLLSAISGWLKKRSQARETDAWPPPTERPMRPPPPRPRQTPAPSPGPQPAPPPARSWEEELRRLLEGENPLEAPPPVPQPTAPPTPPERQPARPPPVSRPTRTEIRRPPPPPLVISPKAPPPLTVPAAAAAAEAEGPDVHLVTLSESAQAYQRAQRLHQRAAEELKRAENWLAQHPPPSEGHRPRVFSPEIERTRAWFAQPQTARQAVLASVILGPAKGLG